MEFQDVLRRRRMVRRYESRAVPRAMVDQLVRNALRAPSAGFSQGWGFLVLDEPDDVARFRTAVTLSDDTDPQAAAPFAYAATFEAPVVIVPCANKSVYLNRYSRPEQRDADGADAWWPAPFWDIDTGFASLLILLTAVNLGLGACFFGVPNDRLDAFRDAFAVPADFRPIGGITVGFPADRPRDVSAERRPEAEVIHRGRWGVSAAPD